MGVGFKALIVSILCEAAFDEAHMTSTIKEFRVAIEEEALNDLKLRIERTRWPDRETVGDWSQGAPLANVQALCAHWHSGYDWRRFEARLNALGQYKTEIDGLNIHYLHVRSPHPKALPLLITHGWPGSVAEFMKVIGPLTDPPAYGGAASDAFDVIAPSLPGFGFSDKPLGTGWGVARIAHAWIELMSRLGYARWVAQGGDWGSAVTSALGAAHPSTLAAIHVNMPLVYPRGEQLEEMTQAEQAAVAALAEHRDSGMGYSTLQSTRPQTLAYGLADSPVGQAAWIYEKMWAWTDHRGQPEDVLSLDEMLDNIMLYWLPGTAASSARLYWESFDSFKTTKLDIPTGVTIYPREIFRPSRRWAERVMSNIIHWREAERGGHFAAWEQPEGFVREIRDCFRHFR